MLKNKEILAIVPARGGSKGIKHKNLRKINNKSLVRITAEFIKKIVEIDLSIISTDNLKIAKEGKRYGLLYPFKRPRKLSGDLVSDYSVIIDVLKKIEKQKKKKFDIILLFQPTSLPRKVSEIRKIIRLLISKNADSVWTCSKIDKKFHPLKILKKNNNDYLNFYNHQGKKIVARQQLDDLYIRNGICYAIQRETLFKYKNIFGKKCLAFEIHRNIVNIDNFFDLNAAKKIVI